MGQLNTALSARMREALEWLESQPGGEATQGRVLMSEFALNTMEALYRRGAISRYKLYNHAGRWCFVYVRNDKEPPTREDGRL